MNHLGHPWSSKGSCQTPPEASRRSHGALACPTESRLQRGGGYMAVPPFAAARCRILFPLSSRYDCAWNTAESIHRVLVKILTLCHSSLQKTTQHETKPKGRERGHKRGSTREESSFGPRVSSFRSKSMSSVWSEVFSPFLADGKSEANDRE